MSQTPQHFMLVGRDTELATLNAHFAQMLEGRGSVVFLTGEAGLGKTTLVRSWFASLGEISDFGSRISDKPFIDLSFPRSEIRNPKFPTDAQFTLFSESACSIPIGSVGVGELEALQPWIDVIDSLARSIPEDSGHHPNADKKQKHHKIFDLKKFMIDTAPSWITMVPVLGPSVGAAMEILGAGYDQVYMHKKYHSDHGATSGTAQNQQQVFQQYVNLISRIAEESPLVIFIDDLHWADTSSINLLFYLARQISEKRILVICTYRADDAVAANDGKGHPVLTVKNEILRYECGEELVLGYLNVAAIRQLLVAQFPGYVIDDRLELWLRKISDGNALFVVQFIRTLSEDGHLNEHGKFSGSYADIGVPRTALAVVEERMRRLDADTRELLCYASVEGIEFTSYILQQVSEMKPMQMLKTLQRAMQLGLIVERNASREIANTTTEVFAFTHALFHQVLYESLMSAQRKLIHRACFTMLKSEWDRVASGNASTGTLATSLLIHAEQCGEWKCVAEVALANASQYWNAYAEVESREMIAKATNAIEHVGVEDVSMRSQQGDALFLRGLIGRSRGKYDDALTDFITAEKYFHDTNATEREIDCVNAQSSVQFLHRAYPEAMELAEKGAEASAHNEYNAGEAAALNVIGNIYWAREDFDKALEYYRSSFDRWHTIGDRSGEAISLVNIGTMEFWKGEYDNALATLNKSLEICEATANHTTEATVLRTIGSVHLTRGEHSTALNFYTKSLSLLETTGDRTGQAPALNNIGAVYYTLGEIPEALSFFTRSLAVSREIGDLAVEADALNNIGSIHLDKNEFDLALVNFQSALSILESIGSKSAAAETLASIAVVEERMK